MIARKQALELYLGCELSDELSARKALAERLCLSTSAADAFYANTSLLAERDVQNPKEKYQRNADALHVVGPITRDAAFIRDVFDEDATSARDVRQALAEQEGDLTIFINSPGGSVSEVAEMATMLDEYRAKGAKITTVCAGVAASAGCVLFLVGDTRETTELSRFMVHRAQIVMLLKGDINALTREYEAIKGALDSFDSQLISMLEKRLTLSKDEIASALDKETWYNAEQAREIGLATGARSAAPEAQNAVADTLRSGAQALERCTRIARITGGHD